jgi:putative acetyltransferase
MITIRHYQAWDAPELWNIFYHTIRYINRSDYSQAQVCAWAPDHLDSALWQQRMDDISPYIAELEGRVVAMPICKQMVSLIIFSAIINTKEEALVAS